MDYEVRHIRREERPLLEDFLYEAVFVPEGFEGQIPRSFMEGYAKREYVELAAHGYRMLADAIEANRPYGIDCPALLLCGERDRAGDVKAFNRKWTAGEGIPLVWVPGAGHNSNVDASEFVNEQIERFVEGLEL